MASVAHEKEVWPESAKIPLESGTYNHHARSDRLNKPLIFCLVLVAIFWLIIIGNFLL